MAISENNLPDLDECVLGALQLFQKTKIPSLSFSKLKKPMVVGSGNAAVTGRILFEGTDAIFADESTFESKLSIKGIDSCVLISASGGKHAPIIAKLAKSKGLSVTLLTNNANAAAKEFSDTTHVFPKLPEPYTYNTSTYMGMILGKTKESPAEIEKHVKAIARQIPNDLHKYNAYYLMLPSEVELLREMLVTKFDELFGPRVVGRVYTMEQTKHAKTVVGSPKELFITFGVQNTIFGSNRLFVPLPKNFSYGMAMATSYYVMGHVQKQHPPYFKKNIGKYIKDASKVFGQKLSIVVE